MFWTLLEPVGKELGIEIPLLFLAVGAVAESATRDFGE